MNEDEFADRCELSVTFFTDNLLYRVLYKGARKVSPKQKELFGAFQTEPHVLAIFNRQGGKTEDFADYDTHGLCYGKAPDGSPDHTFIYAPILKQTDIIMGRIHQYFNTIPLLDGFIKTRQKYFIEMLNGNTLTALSASDQSHVRGFSPTKIQIDESQDISDRVYYEDILPSGAATGANIQETGTPKGRNHFFEAARRGSGAVVIKQHWTECPFIDREYVLKRKKHMPRDKFNAEFCNIFLAGSNVAFPTDMLDKMIHLEPDDDIEGIEKFYFGGDIGKQDETVFIIFGLKNGELFMVDMRRLSAFASYQSVFDEINEILDEYPIAYGLVDMTGVGEVVADLIPSSANIDGLWLENEPKQEMVDEFMILGEGGAEEEGVYNPKVHLWKDYDLRQQFYEWECKPLKSGKKRYHHPTGGHDDIVVAGLLGVRAYNDDITPVSYGTSSSPSRSMAGVSSVSGRSPMGILRHANPYTKL